MGREQDLLFCKIAISTKKVSQEDAQKVLALANRLEAEGKRRPQVGEIFLKNNLLTDQDVLRIYGAVQKRMGAQGTPDAAATAPAHPAAAARQPARSAVAARSSPARQAPAAAARPRPGRAVKARNHPGGGEGIDSTTLWMGIVFGVIAMGCVGAIIYLILKKPPEVKNPDNFAGLPKAVSTPAAPLPAVPSSPGAASPAPGVTPAVAPAAPAGTPPAANPVPAVAPGAAPSPPGTPEGAASSPAAAPAGTSP